MCCEPEPVSALSQFKEFFPLISPVLILLLFIVERVLSYQIRQKEINRTWYYKVLIDPHIEKINVFFSTLGQLYSDSAGVLSSSLNLPHSEFLALKREEFTKFQKSKRELELIVIAPILHRYPKTGEKLTEELRGIEDLFTGSLDSGKFSIDDIDSLTKHVSSVRAVWLNILYEPIG
jgi:hypothetical protein